MAAFAESVALQDLSLVGLHMPLTIRLEEELSDEELIAFSYRNRPYRIERNDCGELEIMSPLGNDGGEREMLAGAMLFLWAEVHGGRCVSPNAGFALPSGAVRSPDASWTSDTRPEKTTAAERRKFPPIVPDFLIEILSESDSRTKLMSKMRMWIENGALLAWMIDPFAAEVLVYRPNAVVQVIHRPDWVVAESVVTGFRLETARMWARSSARPAFHG